MAKSRERKAKAARTARTARMVRMEPAKVSIPFELHYACLLCIVFQELKAKAERKAPMEKPETSEKAERKALTEMLETSATASTRKTAAELERTLALRTDAPLVCHFETLIENFIKTVRI